MVSVCKGIGRFQDSKGSRPYYPARPGPGMHVHQKAWWPALSYCGWTLIKAGHNPRQNLFQGEPTRHCHPVHFRVHLRFRTEGLLPPVPKAVSGPAARSPGNRVLIHNARYIHRYAQGNRAGRELRLPAKDRVCPYNANKAVARATASPPKDECKFDPVFAVPKVDHDGDEYVHMCTVLKGIRRIRVRTGQAAGGFIRSRRLEPGIRNIPGKSFVAKSEWPEVSGECCH